MHKSKTCPREISKLWYSGQQEALVGGSELEQQVKFTWNERVTFQLSRTVRWEESCFFKSPGLKKKKRSKMSSKKFKKNN